MKVIVIQSFDVKAEALIGKEWSASWSEKQSWNIFYKRVKDLVNQTLWTVGLYIDPDFFPKYHRRISFSFLLEHFQVQGWNNIERIASTASHELK